MKRSGSMEPPAERSQVRGLERGMNGPVTEVESAAPTQC